MEKKGIASKISLKLVSAWTRIFTTRLLDHPTLPLNEKKKRNRKKKHLANIIYMRDFLLRNKKMRPREKIKHGRVGLRCDCNEKELKYFP